MNYVWIVYDKDKLGNSAHINNFITICSTEEKADAVMDSLIALRRYRNLGAYKFKVDEGDDMLKTELRLEKESLEAIISRLEGA